MTWIQNLLAFIGLCVCMSIFSYSTVGFFSFSFFLIPLFSDRFQWIEQDNAVPVVFAFHVIAFAHFVIFTDFRNSKRILQLDDFIRIN